MKLSEDERAGLVRARVLDLLATAVGEDLAEQIIKLRESKDTVKPFDLYRANITLELFKKSPDPELAAWEYVNRAANMTELTVEYARKCISYDPSSGIFTSRLFMGSGKRLPGDPLGSVGSHGYMTTMVAGRAYLLHRLAWFMVHGRWPKEAIDHIDQNKLNNRLSNLRECTLGENNWNLPLSPLNSSGVTGVHWDKRSGRWMATIRADGKTKYLGKFKQKDDAASAYQSAVSRYRGHFLEASQ